MAGWVQKKQLLPTSAALTRQALAARPLYPPLPRNGLPQTGRAYHFSPSQGAIYIESVLGQGGRSTVFAVFGHQLGRGLALRATPLFDEDHALLYQSLRLQQACVGPHIIESIALWASETHAYALLERGSQVSVEDLLSRHHRSKTAPVGVTRSLQLFEMMVRAVASCHARGVVHGDIKPENFILMDESHPQSACKLSDFELATREGQTVIDWGTVNYLSPELLRGARAHPAGDLWALGVSLYRILVGIEPFDSDDEHEVARQILALEPAFTANDLSLALQAARLEVVQRRHLEQLVDALLQRDPSHRPTARDVLVSLKDFGAL